MKNKNQIIYISLLFVLSISSCKEECNESTFSFVDNNEKMKEVVYFVKSIKVPNEEKIFEFPLLIIEIHNNTSSDINITEEISEYQVKSNNETWQFKYYEDSVIKVLANNKRFYRISPRYGYLPDAIYKLNKSILKTYDKLEVYAIFKDKSLVRILKAPDFVICQKNPSIPE